MKQKIAMMIVGSVFVLSFALAGCGSEQQTSSETESTSQTVSRQSSSGTSSGASSGTNTSSQVTNSVSETVTVTIPEGFTWDLIAKRLEANEICSAEDFYQACQNYSPKSFSIPIDENRPFKMEGYLYPATYTFQKNSNAEDVLIEMLNAYRNNTGGNVTDTELIVASIVQMETRSPEQMQSMQQKIQLRQTIYISSLAMIMKTIIRPHTKNIRLQWRNSVYNTENPQNDKKDAEGHLFYFAKTWNVSYNQGIYLKGIKIRKGVLQWPYQI